MKVSGEFGSFFPRKRQALIAVVRGECTDDYIPPILFYPLLDPFP